MNFGFLSLPYAYPTVKTVRVLGPANFDRLAKENPPGKVALSLGGPDIVGKTLTLASHPAMSRPFYVTKYFHDRKFTLQLYHVCDLGSTVPETRRLDGYELAIVDRKHNTTENYEGTQVTMTLEDIPTRKFKPEFFEPFELFLVKHRNDGSYDALFYKGRMSDRLFNHIKQTRITIDPRKLH